jgi:hypothetical protein
MSDASEMKVVLPEDSNVPVIGEDVITGEGFQFELQD